MIDSTKSRLAEIRLALIALQQGSIQSIITSALYDALVFAPCIYLTLRRE